MHRSSDRDMAIPRMFNSNTPFIIVSGGAELSFLGKEDDSQAHEEEAESLVQAIAPHLSRVMQHGTAKHVVTEGSDEPEEDPCVCIVAQAEREDFQEFSPTNTHRPYPDPYSQLLHNHRTLEKSDALLSDTEVEDFVAITKPPRYHLHRKQRGKSRRGRSPEAGEEPPIIRGLWVQEIDWLKCAIRETTSAAAVIPPPPRFTDLASPCCSLFSDIYEASECVSGDQHRPGDAEDGGSDSDCSLERDSGSICTHDSESDSSCCAENNDKTEVSLSDPTFDLMYVSGLNWGSSLAGLSDSTCASSAVSAPRGTGGLRGRVTQMPKQFVSPFCKDWMGHTLSQWETTKPVNEGILLHHLQPRGSQYREGEEYCVLHHIHNGSYGDVFCVQDKRTGLKCAAKRIPLSRFSSEEVIAWSLLSSPRVVELFGAVREGLNVVLFMDLKPACLAQLLKQMKTLPEDLALHYLHQSMGALEHLHHRKVLHLDVKVDNVLLSADCRDTFLCDFGLSETLDDNGRSVKAFRGAAFPGTQTHMAPEVARGDQLSAKADVWSSCCMLLHMLNGCHPWTRFYSHPLCLQIVNEPPPLWEVPSNCNNFTAKVFRAGLQKDPDRRASARELRRKTTKALRAVGGLSPWSIKAAGEKLYCDKSRNEDDTLSQRISPKQPSAPVSAPTMHWVSPWRTTAADEDWEDSNPDSEVGTDSLPSEWDSQPKSLRDDVTAEENDWGSDLDVDMYIGEEDFLREKWVKTDRDYEGDWEDEEEEEEEEWDSSVSTEYLRALRGRFPLLHKVQETNDSLWGSDLELEYLRDDVPKGTRIQTPSPEPRDDPPSCFSCSDTSQLEASEMEDSDRSSDDMSSGVFSSCNSHTDGHLEWSASANRPSSCCFEGVDIWIENVHGECLRIRERRQVQVSHVALGLSDQISGKDFTLETLDRKTVSFEQEVTDSCLWLRCVPAPDRCQRWRWRVRDGKLELRE